MEIEMESKNNLDDTIKKETQDKIEEIAEDITQDAEKEIEEEAETEKDNISLMAEFIRDRSYSCKITNAENFFEEPFLLDVDEVLALIDELKARDEFKDLYSIKGSEAIYLFSGTYISYNYAEMMVMVEEKDLLKLIVETVRHESKTYPRPTDSKLFLCNPFKLSKEQINEVLDQLKRKKEYNDIKETRASNKALYLYSDKFMSAAYARSLAEWVEVEHEQCP